MTVTLTLPYPPTANNLFLNVGKRRVRTKQYDAWIQAALWEVKAQAPGKIDGAYHMRLIADRPDRRARDIEKVPDRVLGLKLSDQALDAGVQGTQRGVGRILPGRGLTNALCTGGYIHAG